MVSPCAEVGDARLKVCGRWPWRGSLCWLATCCCSSCCRPPFCSDVELGFLWRFWILNCAFHLVFQLLVFLLSCKFWHGFACFFGSFAFAFAFPHRGSSWRQPMQGWKQKYGYACRVWEEEEEGVGEGCVGMEIYFLLLKVNRVCWIRFWCLFELVVWAWVANCVWEGTSGSCQRRFFCNSTL